MYKNEEEQIQFQSNYDIERFTDNLPVKLTTLELGEELTIEKENAPETDPLFKNMTWLWTIIGVIILVPGWFSIKMMKKE